MELDRLRDEHQILLTSYRRNGTPVGTPVNIAFDGGHAYFRTSENAAKVRRIHNNPAVEVAPSTIRGKPTGPASGASARLLAGAEAESARLALVRKHRIVHGIIVPLRTKLTGHAGVYYELKDAPAS